MGSLSKRQLFSLVLAALDEAALDDSKWPACARLIDEICGTAGSSISFSSVGAAERASIFFARICLGGERRLQIERDYFHTYYPLDEAVPRYPSVPDGELVHISDLYSDKEKETSRTYNDFLVANNIQNSVHVHLSHSHESCVSLTLLRSKIAGSWNSDRPEMIKRLLPHISRFTQLRQALFDARASRQSLTELLDNTRLGVIELDWRHRIVQANDCARNLLLENDGLFDKNGFLRARAPEDNRNLEKVLDRARPRLGDPGVSGCVTIGRKSVAPRLLLHALPVGGEWGTFEVARLGVLILIIDPATKAVIDPKVVAAALDLTRSESQIASLLAGGDSIREIAQSTDREESTIRWHVRRIFEKQSITRQTELIRRILELSGYRL